MDKEQVKELLFKYERGWCTADEKAFLEHWYYCQNTNEIPNFEQIDADLDDVWERLRINRERAMWPRIVAAASIIFLLFTANYLIFRRITTTKQFTAVKRDILPGHNQATLILANGQKIVLTKNISGRLATQGQTSIIAANHNIIYSAGSSPKTASYNTLVTARGQQSPAPLILADGTKVWLNSDSKLIFPTAFLNKERIVRLSGEAYFEVAKDRLHPFVVSTSQQDVRVLGTHFNISSYEDDPSTITTLLEGRVEVTAKSNHISGVLRPGQQALLKDEKIVVAAVDTEEAMAWKDGYFMFESGDIQSIMRKVSRWYNVKVIYKGPIPQTKFYLVADRFSNISSLLKPLEMSNRIHFTIEGRRIMVSK
jgi:transmembrane sensor